MWHRCPRHPYVVDFIRRVATSSLADRRPRMLEQPGNPCDLGCLLFPFRSCTPLIGRRFRVCGLRFGRASLERRNHVGRCWHIVAVDACGGHCRRMSLIVWFPPSEKGCGVCNMPDSRRRIWHRGFAPYNAWVCFQVSHVSIGQHRNRRFGTVLECQVVASASQPVDSSHTWTTHLRPRLYMTTKSSSTPFAGCARTRQTRVAPCIEWFVGQGSLDWQDSQWASGLGPR